VILEIERHRESVCDRYKLIQINVTSLLHQTKVMSIDTYLFLPLSNCIIITININQMVIIMVLNHFSIFRPIRFQLKVCYYFDTIHGILTNLSMFCIFPKTFDTKLRFT